MRRLAALACAAMLVAPAGTVTAGGPPPPQPGPGYFATPNVSYHGTIPLDADTAGGRLLGKTFYVLTAKGLTIYDVSIPTVPVPLGFTPLPHTPNQEREDVDTDGRILVAGQSYLGILYVVDVSNPRVPVLLSTLRGAAGHTNTCVLRCTWVYSSEGDIIDLRDPRNPKLAGRWTGPAGVGGSHDWTEVQPGLLMGATNPVVYLDARRDPARPKRIGVGLAPPRYMHGNVWPRGGKDRWLLVGSESGYTCSDPSDGAFMVFDTKRFRTAGRFDYVGDFWLGHGLPTEGKARVNELCGHWFQPHPSFHNGGLVAMAWYGFGTRFLEVTSTGKVVEKGYFIGNGQASSAYWVGEDVVYSLDYVRGIDILKFDRSAPAHPSGQGRWNPRTATTVLRPPAATGSYYVCPVA